MSESTFDIRKAVAPYVGVGRRALGYWKVGLALCLVVAVGGAAFAATRREVWTSHTRIRVVSARVSTAGEAHEEEGAARDLEARLDAFTRSRRFLQDIVDEHGLYRDLRERRGLTDEEVLEHMRTKLAWDVYDRDGFGFHFSDHDPDVARAVCESLTESFIRERTRSETSVARTKVARVERQLADVEAQLAAAEARRTRFEEANAGLIAEMRRQEGLGIASAAGDAPVEPSGAARPRPDDSPRLRALRRRLAELEDRAGRLRARGREGRAEADERLEARLASVEADLRRAEARFDGLAERYTREYPGVAQAEERVVELRRQKRDLEAQVRERRAAGRLSSGELAETEREVESLRQRVGALAREEAEARRRARAAGPGESARADATPSSEARLEVDDDLHARPLETVPEVVTALKRLETEIDPLRERRQRLHARKLELDFQLQQQLEAGTQYVVIDPASRPGRPSGPRRAWIALGLGAVGLLLGVGAMALLGFADNRIYRPADAGRVDQVPLLAAVPDYEDDIDLAVAAAPPPG